MKVATCPFCGELYDQGKNSVMRDHCSVECWMRMRYTPEGWSINHAILTGIASTTDCPFEIAEWLGLSVKQVHRCRNQLLEPGAARFDPRAYSKEEDDQLRELFPVMSTEKLAAQMGRSPSPIHRRARRLGLTKEPAYLLANGWGFSLLPPELRAVISLSNQLKKEVNNAKRQHATRSSVR